jgi:hypothetical protein
MTKLDAMETFVVRIWRPAPAYDADGDQVQAGQSLRGMVRRVAGGTELPFAGVDELIDLLSATPPDPAPVGRSRAVAGAVEHDPRDG